MERVCQGCQSLLPPKTWPGRDRKWCSERCRRTTLYAHSCVDCGAALSTSDGCGPNAPQRCPRCSGLAQSRASGRAERVVEMVRLRSEEGLTNIQIADRVGSATHTVATELSRMRVLGFDVPAAPYRSARTHGAASRDAACETLERELARIGVYPPQKAAA